MITKKGDIWRYKDITNRGLSNNIYFYCIGVLDDFILMSKCIIRQDGKILINDYNLERYTKSKFNDLELITIKDFLKDKFNFLLHTSVDFKHYKYDTGIIRDIDEKKKKLTIEVENEDLSGYDEIIINFKDVLIVYPEFTFNDRKNFKLIENEYEKY
jgi:hypothetical protein